MRSTLLALPVALVCLLCISLPKVAAQGNTTCKTTSLDWYTSTVGETPCRTYERLRQICNAAYRVGSLSPATPPDTCDDQLANCCCNSISFALSMLCLNCQQGVGTGLNGDNGIDAGVGAYQDYLGHCSPNVNKTLPHDIQAAVCNNRIKIDDDLYGLFWDNGAWFYMYTRGTIQKNQQALANNTFTHCASTTINSTTSSSTGGTTSRTTSRTTSSTTGDAVTLTSLPNSTTPTSRSSSLSVGAIAGVAIGAVAVLLLAAILLFFLWRRRRNSSAYKPSIIPQSDTEEMTHQIRPFVTPASVGSSSPSYDNSGTSVGLSQSGNNKSPQAQLLFNNNSQPSSRSEKYLQRTPLQTSNNNPLIRHSPLPSMSSSSNVTALPLSSQVSSGEISERHVDGGPLLQRSASGRLPPAYGELWDGV